MKLILERTKDLHNNDYFTPGWCNNDGAEELWLCNLELNRIAFESLDGFNKCELAIEKTPRMGFQPIYLQRKYFNESETIFDWRWSTEPAKFFYQLHTFDTGDAIEKLIELLFPGNKESELIVYVRVLPLT